MSSTTSCRKSRQGDRRCLMVIAIVLFCCMIATSGAPTRGGSISSSSPSPSLAFLGNRSQLSGRSRDVARYERLTVGQDSSKSEHQPAAGCRLVNDCQSNHYYNNDEKKEEEDEDEDDDDSKADFAVVRRQQVLSSSWSSMMKDQTSHGSSSAAYSFSKTHYSHGSSMAELGYLQESMPVPCGRQQQQQRQDLAFRSRTIV
ncbi:hypothetical protein ACA910_004317 [Epithemia clementina (nom. ined.)]